jgi:ATP-dependent DNA helicase RecG
MHIANPDAVIAIQVPDYRAKIDNMKISGKKVTLTIESRISDKLVAKFYADSDKEGDYSRSLLYFMKSKDQDIISNTIEYEFPNHFDSVTVAISGKSSNDPLDCREYDFRWQTGEGVEVDRGEEDIRELISRGENLNVEYKQILEPREFLETVVAFANTKGGVIFLGVNDNCQIVGCREDVSKIMNLITSNLDPRPRFSVKHIQIDDKPIMMVEIPEGDNKPYVHRERGPYVRSNSSDRPPTRAEIDDFYKKNNRPF